MKIKKKVKFINLLVGDIFEAKIVGYKLKDYVNKKGNLIKSETIYQMSSGDEVDESLIIKNKKQLEKAKIDLAKIRISRNNEKLTGTLDYIYDLLHEIKRDQKILKEEKCQ